MNTKQAFHKVKILTGQLPSQAHSTITDPTTFAATLNSFYTWFDTQNHSATCEELLNALPPDIPAHPPFTTVEVQQQLSRCKAGKAPGPDNISAKVLKLCAMELAPPLHSIFWDSYRSASIPTIWKTSTIIPVPKNPRPPEPNHYRPVALTSIIMNCLEKLILHIILPVFRPLLDPHQFAYRASRGTEDAVTCLLHPLLQHLESPGTFASILFIDFSSAFNTIQRHRMIKKLRHLNIPPPLIHWIHNFLTDRHQAVRIGTVTSSTIITNTGAPQGCVLSPFLYTLYTNDCISPSPITTYFKYSDDTAILGLLSDNNSITAYQLSISHFTQWCTDNFLELNVAKTKEMVIHTSRTPPSGLVPTSIHNQTVEQVSHFKYLGLTIDNKLTFDQHIINIHKRSQQRLHVIRKLHALSVAPHLLSLLYTSIIQPILLYCSPGFSNMLSISNRNKLTKITHIASKIINHPTPILTELNLRAVTCLARAITVDPDHPLHPHFTLLPSGRRYRTLRWRRARFNKSFVPSAISALNNLPQ